MWEEWGWRTGREGREVREGSEVREEREGRLREKEYINRVFCATQEQAK